MCHARIHETIYNWSNYVRTKIQTKYIDTTDVSFHGVRRVEFLDLYFKGHLMQGFQSGFHCVIPSGFKGPAVSSVSSEE